MADDLIAPTPTAGEPQAGDPSHVTPQPQAGANSTLPTTPQAGDSQNNDPTISLEEAKKLRSEAANLRKRMKAYEDAETAARDAQLSETERLKKQYEDLKSQHDTSVKQAQERLVRYEVEKAAARVGIRDPEIAAKLLDYAELDYEDDGSPKNAVKLLERLVKTYPYLAAPKPEPAAPAPSNTPAASTPAQTVPPTMQPMNPALPAMNPGRASILAPNAAQPGTVPAWGDILAQTRRG